MTNKVSAHRKSYGQLFKRNTVAEAISVAMMASLISAPAFAADLITEKEKEETEVIIVTATKKNETIQEVPLAITAITGKFIEQVRLTDVKDIVAYSPGVNGNNNNSFLDSVSVRGVRTDDYGPGSDSSLAFFKNDLFEGRTGPANSSFYDMDRAEVVNGPQGFLFGRNAIGGAVSVHTARAEVGYFDANIDVDFGDYGLIKVNGAINIPISDNFAMRFAGLHHSEESYIKNINEAQPLQDTEVSAIRWSTTYQKDDFSAYTMVEYEDRSYPAGQYRIIEEDEVWDEYNTLWGVGNRGGERDIDVNSHWGLRDEAQVLNLQLKLEQKFDFADLTFNAGYKDYDYWYSEQWIPSPEPSGSWAVDSSGDYSQAELRLNSNGEGPLSWYVGASIYKENLNWDTLNAMSEEFMCAYYNGFWGGEPNNGSTTGHCDNFMETLGPDYAAYYYPGLLNGPNRADGQVEERSDTVSVNNGWAVYANFSYAITENLDVELGIRKTDDSKEFANNMTSTGYMLGNFYNVSNSTAEPIKAKDSWDDTTFKYLVRWKPTDEMMLYASYTEGFKAGGFSTSDLDGVEWGETDVTNENAKIASFDPEYIESYEFGYKDTWFEDTDVRFTAYMYDYFGLQVTQRADEGGAVVVENTGKVESYGIEAATNTSLTDNWSLMLNFSMINSEAYGIQKQCFEGNDPAGPSFDGSDGFNDCEGSKLYWAPEFSGAAVLNGYFPLESGSAITTSIETHWESEHGGGYNFYDAAIVEASQTWNARLGYESDSDWYVEAYVDNLMDEVNYDSSYLGGGSYDGMGAGAYPMVRWASWKPRSFGLRFGMTFE